MKGKHSKSDRFHADRVEPSISCITLSRSTTTFSGCLAAQTKILGSLFSTAKP